MFLQPWWLELVAPSEWHYAVVKRGQEIAAVMPYTIRSRFGWRILETPQFTPHLGPWLRPSTAKYANRLSEEKELMTELIAALPPFAHFEQRFHPGITNWLPFFWKEFRQTTLYTYRIEDTRDPEKLWDETRDNVRTDIRKARKQIEVEVTDDFEYVIRMQTMTLQRQHLRMSFSDERFRRFGAGCAAQGASRVLVARDARGRVHACVYLLLDSSTVYYYTGGGDPELRNSGATSLLVWKAIEMAAALGLKFDFEGSVLEPVERFFRSFGAVQTPFFVISKTNSKLLHGLRGTVSAIKGRINRAAWRSRAKRAAG